MEPIPELGLDLGLEGIKSDGPEGSEASEEAELSASEIPRVVFMESGNALGCARP